MTDSFQSRSELLVNAHNYIYFSLPEAARRLGNIESLPFSLKILLENLLRHEDGQKVTKADIQAVADWLKKRCSTHEIAYHPARVLMQDFTGVPAVVDLAAMRDAMAELRGDPEKINPLCPVDLIIDHSVQVDEFGTPHAYQDNVHIEIERNHERYQFLKWGQKAFGNFRLVPPGTGICHQVNLEYLGRGVWSGTHNGVQMAYPDTLVGTDSHTTMINGLGVLGWGVGGIEAEAAMLGQPISMLIPEVIGFRLEGKLREGITATDLVLTITQMLRARGVVGKFVEFYGPGLQQLSVADRATIGNMAPEYGATCGLFPIDEETIKYLQLTNRDAQTIALVKAYAQAQGLWHDANTPEPVFTDKLVLNLDTVEPSLAGPKRPQDRVSVKDLRHATEEAIKQAGKSEQMEQKFTNPDGYTLQHGDLVIAAITSCTNTSNPSVMVGAGLVAKKAVEKGLTAKPWVKASLAPGSKVVTDYLVKTDLMPYLDKLGFYLVGYGCTTCIGNSGPLPESVTKTIQDNDLLVGAVLSGNRNFEGRIHPLTKTNWLASPPLVVAYALAGTSRIDLSREPIGNDTSGQPVYLKDIWPSQAEVAAAVNEVNRKMFAKEYSEVFSGDEEWKKIPVAGGANYRWQPDSTYVQHPPFFVGMTAQPAPLKNIANARILALLGDSVTTDHISPAGAIKADSPAGRYLREHGVAVKDFNAYGARRGNHEVMMRGTFANIRIRNEMIPGVEGGFTLHYPDKTLLPIYDAAMKYQQENIPLVIIAGREYGSGSSRDWAAKGTLLLGVKAVVAESFERIHRSNLIGMGVLPLEFTDGITRKTLRLDGSEIMTIEGLTQGVEPGAALTLQIKRADGSKDEARLHSRIDTQDEAAYYRHGGILQYVLRQMLRKS
jgi:aconitate hydratase